MRRENHVTEQQARHCQLEVLEQTRIKNTLDFLETSVGKTLIAVVFLVHNTRYRETSELSVIKDASSMCVIVLL